MREGEKKRELGLPAEARIEYEVRLIAGWQYSLSCGVPRAKAEDLPEVKGQQCRNRLHAIQWHYLKEGDMRAM